MAIDKPTDKTARQTGFFVSITSLSFLLKRGPGFFLGSKEVQSVFLGSKSRLSFFPRFKGGSLKDFGASEFISQLMLAESPGRGGRLTF